MCVRACVRAYVCVCVCFIIRKCNLCNQNYDIGDAFHYLLKSYYFEIKKKKPYSYTIPNMMNSFKLCLIVTIIYTLKSFQTFFKKSVK